MKTIYIEYMQLLRQFLEHRMSASEFQSAYLETFKNESRILDEPLFTVLDELYGDIDSFVENPILFRELNKERPGFFLNEKELYERVAKATEVLARLQTK